MLVGRADRKNWWHNLRRPAHVDLWLAGEHVRARALVISGSTDPAQATAGLAVYRRAMPHATATPARVTLVRADITGDA